MGSASSQMEPTQGTQQAVETAAYSSADSEIAVTPHNRIVKVRRSIVSGTTKKQNLAGPGEPRLDRVRRYTGSGRSESDVKAQDAHHGVAQTKRKRGISLQLDNQLRSVGSASPAREVSEPTRKSKRKKIAKQDVLEPGEGARDEIAPPDDAADDINSNVVQTPGILDDAPQKLGSTTRDLAIKGRRRRERQRVRNVDPDDENSGEVEAVATLHDGSRGAKGAVVAGAKSPERSSRRASALGAANGVDATARKATAVKKLREAPKVRVKRSQGSSRAPISEARRVTATVVIPQPSTAIQARTPPISSEELPDLGLKRCVDPTDKLGKWFDSQDAPSTESLSIPQSRVSSVVPNPDNASARHNRGGRRAPSLSGTVPVSLPAPLYDGPEKGAFSRVELAIADTVFEHTSQLEGIEPEALKTSIATWATANEEFKTQLHVALPNRDRNSLRKMCYRRFSTMQTGPWEDDEDERLREAYVANPDKWAQISLSVGRTGQACRDRWRNIVQYGKVRGSGAWSVEEEEDLIDIVKECLHLIAEDDKDAREDDLERWDRYAMNLNWKIVVKGMGGTRNERACREKWAVIKRKVDQGADFHEITTTKAAAFNTETKGQRRVKSRAQQLKPGDFHDVMVEICNAMPEGDGIFREESTLWGMIALKNPRSRFDGPLRRRAFQMAVANAKEDDLKGIEEAMGVVAKARLMVKPLWKAEAVRKSKGKALPRGDLNVSRRGKKLRKQTDAKPKAMKSTLLAAESDEEEEDVSGAVDEVHIEQLPEIAQSVKDHDVDSDVAMEDTADLVLPEDSVSTDGVVREDVPDRVVGTAKGNGEVVPGGEESSESSAHVGLAGTTTTSKAPISEGAVPAADARARSSKVRKTTPTKQINASEEEISSEHESDSGSSASSESEMADHAGSVTRHSTTPVIAEPFLHVSSAKGVGTSANLPSPKDKMPVTKADGGASDDGSSSEDNTSSGDNESSAGNEGTYYATDPPMEETPLGRSQPLLSRALVALQGPGSVDTAGAKLEKPAQDAKTGPTILEHERETISGDEDSGESSTEEDGASEYSASSSSHSPVKTTAVSVRLPGVTSNTAEPDAEAGATRPKTMTVEEDGSSSESESSSEDDESSAGSAESGENATAHALTIAAPAKQSTAAPQSQTDKRKPQPFINKAVAPRAVTGDLAERADGDTVVSSVYSHSVVSNKSSSPNLSPRSFKKRCVDAGRQQHKQVTSQGATES